MSRKVDTSEFIRMARSVHGEQYDYSNSHYTKSKDPITITCRKHGDFMQRASNHLRGSGCPKCFQERNRGIVCGVGIDDLGQSDLDLFTTWRGMLFRCYDNKYNKSYKNCEVCEEWKTLSSFASWYYIHHIDGWQLDKDILGDGKLYSPQTCCFVPSELNMCIVGRDAKGATFVKGKWQVSFSQKYIGRFDTKEEAVLAYKKRKGEHILCLLEKYRGQLEDNVYYKLNEHVLRLLGIDFEIKL